jgi:hypothetical protein
MLVDIVSPISGKWAKHTEVNRIDAEILETFIACLLAILAGAVNLEGLTSLDKAKLGRYKNLVSLPCMLEPFAYEFFTVSV